MSKSRWHQSLWSSFVSRFARSGRVSRRRSRLQRYGSSPAAELLETRLVPTVSAGFAGGILTITEIAAGADAVRVVTGPAESKIYVNNVLQINVSGATNTSIATVNYTGAGANDSLTIVGNTPTLNAINLEGVPTLTVSARPSSGTLTIDADFANNGDSPLTFAGVSTIVGNLTITEVTNVADAAGATLSVVPTVTALSGTLTIGTVGTPATSVTLDNLVPQPPSATPTGNSYGTVSLAVAGVATIVESGDTNLGDVTITAAGTFSLFSTGSVTQRTGTDIEVAGNTTIDTDSTPVLAGQNRNITLNSATNSFGGALLNLTAHDISITEGAATILGTVTATGKLNVSSTGNIDDAAVLTVAERATFTTTADNVTLDVAGHSFGTISVLGSVDVAILETGSTDLSTTNPTGNLTVTAVGAGAAVTDSGTVTVGGNTVITATGDSIILDSPLNNFDNAGGASTFAFTGSNVTIVDSGANAGNAIDFAASTATGALLVTANGSVTDAGALAITGRATINAVSSLVSPQTTFPITLDISTFGELALRGSVVAITEAGGTELVLSTITTSLSVTATGGDITNNVTPSLGNFGAITVAGPTTFSAVGNDITILSAGDVRSVFGTLTLTGDDITIVEGGGTLLGAVTATGDFILTAVDGIQGGVMSGGISQVAGTGIAVTDLANFQVSRGFNIDLNEAGSTNNFGTLLFEARNVDIVEASATLFNERTSTTSTRGSTAFGNLTLSSAGSISHTSPGATDQRFGKLTVGGTASITTTAAGDILLNQIDPTSLLLGAVAGGAIANGNSFGRLELVTFVGGGGNATIVELGPTNLGTSTIDGDLSVTSSREIEDSGTVVVLLTTTMNAGANSITLDQNDGMFVPSFLNRFVGAVSLTGSNLILRNNTAASTPTILGATTATGSFDLRSSGAVTNPAGLVNVTGKTTITTSGDDVTLGTGTATTLSVVSVLGAEDVSINEADALDLATMNPTASLTLVTAAGAVTDSGTVTVGTTTSITTTGAITLDTPANNFVGAVTIAGAAGATKLVDSAGGIDFGAVTAASLTVNTSGANADVTDNAAGALTIGAGAGAVNITAVGVGSDILLDDAGVHTFGTLTLSGTNIAINEAAGSAPLTLGNTKATGTLTLISGGAVNQAAGTAINVVGTTAVTAVGTVTLANPANHFGAGISLVGAAATDVTIVDFGNTILGAMSMTGFLSVTTTSGAITQTGALVVGTTATLTTGGDITLNFNPTAADGDSNSFSAAGVTLTGRNVTLVEDDASGVDLTARATGNLVVTSAHTATGAVDDIGILNVTGRATFTATGAGSDVAVNNVGNTFGSISAISPDAVTIVEANATDLFTTTAGGLLSVTSGGAVTDNGVVTVAGTTSILVPTNATAALRAAITLDNAANNFVGDVTFNDVGGAAGSGATTFRDGTGGINFAASRSTSLTVTSTGGAVNDTGTLTIGNGGSGAVTVTAATFAITLDDASNTFIGTGVPAANDGKVTLTGASAIINDDSALNMGTTTLTGALTLTSDNAVTQSGNISAGLTTIDTTGDNITLNGTNFVNVFGNLDLSGSNITIKESVAATILDIDATGTLSITTTIGGITEVGAGAGEEITAGATTLTAVGQAIALNDVDNVFGTLVITSASASIFENAAVDLGNLNLTGALSIFTSSDTIDDSGILKVGGTSTFDTDDTGAAGAAILLNNATSTFGTLILDGSTVSVTDAGPINLGTSRADTTFTLIAGGAVTDSGVSLNVGTLTNITATNHAVTLDNGVAMVGGITISGENVLLTNTLATVLANVTAGGNLTVTSGGAITDTVSNNAAPNGITKLNAAGFAITFLGTTDFKTLNVYGATTLLPGATNVTLTSELDGLANPVAIDLGTINLSGTGVLTITTAGLTGSITDSGVLTIQQANLTAAGGTANGSIILNTATSTFGAAGTANGIADLILTADGSIYVKDNGLVELGAITAGLGGIAGDLTILSNLLPGGDISDLGVISNLFGFSTFNAGTPLLGGTVILDVVGHTFTGGRVGTGTFVSIIP